MTVLGLSGKSGSGKSYMAQEIAKSRGADSIIDDGLFIMGNAIVAGISAKAQKTKIGAIKTAIFKDDIHARGVRDAIKNSDPSKILVLGTSDEMVDVICDRLEIPRPSEYIHIEDVSTPEMMKKAHEMRENAGMHTIPAPTFQVKKQFSGYLINPKRSFKKKTDPQNKTILRPAYSYLGSYEISEKVIEQIVGHIIGTIPGCSNLLFCSCDNDKNGMYIRIIIQAERGHNIQEAAYQLQKRVTKTVSYMTAFNILGVEVEIRSFTQRFVL